MGITSVASALSIGDELWQRLDGSYISILCWWRIDGGSIINSNLVQAIWPDICRYAHSGRSRSPVLGRLVRILAITLSRWICSIWIIRHQLATLLT